MEKPKTHKNAAMSKRSKDRLDSANSAAFFKFAYTHRKFKIDCDSGVFDMEAISTAVRKLEDAAEGPLLIAGLLEGVFLRKPARGDLARYVAAMIAKYHNDHIAGPEYKFGDARLEEIGDDIGQEIKCFENELALLHEVTHTYGYFIHALLEDIIPAEHIFSVYQSQDKKPYLETPETFFRKSSQNRDAFHIHFQNRDGEVTFEDKKDGFLYAYVNILGNKPTFRQIVEGIAARIESNIFEDYGEQDSANLQLCLDLSKIDGANKKLIAVLKRRLLRQMESYFNYLRPGQLSPTQQAEIAAEIDGTPNEQMGDMSRIIGLWLWDEVQAACPIHHRRGLMPEAIFAGAAKKVAAQVSWRMSDRGNRTLHNDYLLADECIRQMEVLNGIGQNQKISDHFQFANRKNK